MKPPPPAGLRAEVEDAARRGVPTRTLIERYVDQVSQASIYNWVRGVRPRSAEIAAADPDVRPLPDPVYPVATASSIPTSGSIPYLERLQTNLARLDAILALGIKDGIIRNPRLVLEATKEIGAQLSRAARINAEIADVEAQRRFMRALADIIHEEPPDIRDRIIGKMRAVSATGGVL